MITGNNAQAGVAPRSGGGTDGPNADQELVAAGVVWDP
jgi:hypothetical protein